MTDRYLGFDLSDAFVEGVRATNAIRPRQTDILEQIRRGNETVEETARAQNRQGWVHAASAVTQVFLHVLGIGFSNSSEALKPLGDLISKASDPARDAFNIYTKAYDGKITIRQHETQVAQVRERSLEREREQASSLNSRAMEILTSELRKLV